MYIYIYIYIYISELTTNVHILYLTWCWLSEKAETCCLYTFIIYIFNICVVLNKTSSYFIAHLIIYFISYTQVQSIYPQWPWGDCNEGSLSSVVYSNRRSTEVIWFSNSADCRIPHCISPVSPTAWVIASPTSPPYRSASIILSTEHKTYEDYHKINLIPHSWLLCYVNPHV